MEKENNTDESDFCENKMSDLNSLKPFEFEPKTKRDITAAAVMMKKVVLNTK